MIRRILKPSRVAMILFAALLLALAFVYAIPTAAAHAASLEVVDPGEDGAVVLRLPTLLEFVTIVNVFLLPAIVGLVTNSNFSPFAKYMLHAALAAITALGAELAESLTAGTPYDIVGGLVAAVISFGLGVLAYQTIGKARTKSGTTIATVLAETGNKA